MSKDLKDADEVLQVAFEKIRLAYEKLMPGYTLIVTETHRPVARQKELYAQGRTKPGKIVTNVDGEKVKGYHNHYPSRAIDVAVVHINTGKIIWDQTKYYPLVGIVATVSTELKKKLVSGGSWKSIKDWPHVQLG